MSSFPFGSSDNAASPDVGVWIDERTVESCKDIYYRNPWAIQSSRILMAWILKNPIKVYKGHDEIKMESDMEQRFELFYIPYLKNAFVELLCRGVVPTTFKKYLHITDPVPMVVGGRYALRQLFNESKERYEFGLFRMNNNQMFADFTGQHPDKKVFVFSGWGIEPSPNGSLRSPMSSLVRFKYTVEKMDEYVLLAEAAKNSPWIVTQVSEKGYDGLGIGSDSTTYDPKDRVYQRGELKQAQMASELNNIANSKTIYEQYHRGSGINPNYMGFSDFSDKIPIPKFFPMEPGHTAPLVTMPSARTDWIQKLEHYENLICLAFGVPKSILSGEGRVLAGIKSNQETFFKAIQYWRNIFSDLVNKIYHILYEEEETQKRKKILESALRENITSRRTIEAALFDSQIRFEFPTENYDSFDDSLKKYGLDIISYYEMKRLARRSVGLKEIEVGDEKDKDPFSREEKLAFIGAGTKGSVLNKANEGKESSDSTASERKDDNERPSKKQKV